MATDCKANIVSIGRSMDDYEILSKAGDGTFGTVYLCKRRQPADAGQTSETNTLPLPLFASSSRGFRAAPAPAPVPNKDIVAIKKMKKHYYSWNECMKLREIQALKKLSHENIITLIEVTRERDCLFLVFEHMEENLLELMKRQRGSFQETTICRIVQQILAGLAYIHGHGYFHRDIKPENLLCRNGPESIKIADFGLVREMDGRPPYTEYVSTRWYRAPELLLHSTIYSSAVDVWSVGCITGELYIVRPMFAGRSEIDQIYKICEALGKPNIVRWPEGERLASLIQIKFPEIVPLDLKRILPSCSTHGLDFIGKMLQWAPVDRPSSRELLTHRYLSMGDAVSRFLSN